MAPIDPTSEKELERLSKPALITILRAMAAKIAALEHQIAQLQERLARRSKDSSTSSKPPSSDIVKPPKPKSNNSGKSGGQKGHPGLFRKLFAMERLDEVKEYRLSQCPECRTPLSKEHETNPWIQQTVELPEKLTHVTEHRRWGYLLSSMSEATVRPFAGRYSRRRYLRPQAPKLGRLYESCPSRLLHHPGRIHAGSL